MRVLHVKVEQDDGWFIALGLEEPGVITHGRTLDELVFMVRDAAELLLEEKEIQIELLLPSKLVIQRGARRVAKRRSARSRSAA